MLIDRPQVSEGSVIVNATVPSGTSYPTSANPGELFFRTDLNALHVYASGTWVEAGKASLDAHIADAALHLTTAQNVLLDGLASTLTADELNFVDGVTSPIQAQITSASGDFTAHINDDARHLTSAQNVLVDGITVSSTELNYTVGANAPLQSQINTINSLDNTQNTRLNTLENTTVPAVQTNLNNHMADDTRHLTASQNTLIDAITVTAADINKLAGAAGLTSSIKLSLDQLAGSDYSAKISANGSIGMSGNLALGGNRVTGLGMPLDAADAATKDYVDSFVQGLHWVGSVKAASTGNLVLSGFQTIDGVALTNSDRVLVKDQNTAADNGIYLVASGAWSRSNDFNLAIEINNSAVFVLAGGTLQGKSTWVQTAVVTNLDVDPISFSAFSGPVVNQEGPGITLGSNGLVAVKKGAAIGFDGNNALVVDVFAGGGLMITTNNTTAAPLTTTAAQLALTQSGVTAGSYGSATQSPTFTVDAKGRITTASSVTVTPAFSSITGLPTTLAGYGITNAVNKAGDTMTGNLSISPPSGIALLQVTRATGATGQATINLITTGGAQAGTWQLYNQGSSSNFAIYSSTFGNDIMQMTTAGTTNFIGTVQAPTFIGNLTGNASTLTHNFARTDPTAYPVVWMPAVNNQPAYSSNSVTITSSTGTLNAIGVNTSGQINAQGNQTTGMATSTGGLGGIMVQNSGGATASFMSFHRSGAYAAYFGLDTDNQWKVGGWSMGAAAYPILHSANYNSYSPTLTGVGASGTWPINITGGASTATTVQGFAPSVSVVGSTLATRDGNGYLFGNYFNSTDNSQGSGVTAVMVKAGDNFLRSGTAAAVAGFVGPSITSIGNISTINGTTPANGAIRMTPNLHLNSVANNAVIINWDNGGSGGNLAMRVGNGAASDVWTVTHQGVTNQTGRINAPTGLFNPGGAQGVSTGLTVANGDLTSYRPGGTTGVIYLSSSGTHYLFWDGSNYNLNGGGLIVTGDVTAFSDRRLKTDIEPILEPLEKIDQLNGVTFKRKDTGKYGTGLIAQEVQEVMPNAVVETEDGTLTVAYGNLAGLFVEAIKALNKEVAELRAELNSLKDAK